MPTSKAVIKTLRRCLVKMRLDSCLVAVRGWRSQAVTEALMAGQVQQVQHDFMRLRSRAGGIYLLKRALIRLVRGALPALLAGWKASSIDKPLPHGHCGRILDVRAL